MEVVMSARISPAVPPFAQPVQTRLDQIMQGRPPLTLFTTVARDPRLFERFLAGSLLDRGNLSLRNREIVINRVTALSKSEYEWGVHVAFFGEKAGFTEEQIVSTATGHASDPCWSDEESALIAACDQLHADCDMDDTNWSNLKSYFSDEAIIEILMLAGKYRTVSYLTNALRMRLEDFARHFPARS
jgi:alkylhydroperoxidase family enzyme